MFSVKLNLPQLFKLVNSSHIEQTVLEKLPISVVLRHSGHSAKGPVLSCIIQLTSFFFSKYIIPLSLSLFFFNIFKYEFNQYKRNVIISLPSYLIYLT